MATWTRESGEPLTGSVAAVCDEHGRRGTVSVRWADAGPEMYGVVRGPEKHDDSGCALGPGEIIDRDPRFA